MISSTSNNIACISSKWLQKTSIASIRLWTGFRKGVNPQSCIVTVIEKFKKSLDQGGEYTSLLTDLSKALDFLPHDLIIAQLHAYGFDKASLRFIHSYLTDRYQRVKINNSYSLWILIKHGVPQITLRLLYIYIYIYI